MAARSWVRAGALALLLIALVTLRAGFAQTRTGSISIRLTDLSTKPLEGVTVTLRNQATGLVERGAASRGGT